VIRVEEERLLAASGELRRKVAACARLARDVKVRLVFEEMRLRGDGYTTVVRRLAARFHLSVSQIKRILARREGKEARERRLCAPSRPTHRPPGERRRASLPRRERSSASREGR